MTIEFDLNGSKVQAEVSAGESLFDLLRRLGMKSVKCGCDTSNCGLCTVLMEDAPVLSCSVPAPRALGKRIVTLEGLLEESRLFGEFMAKEGADQCGFCNPGFIMNVIAMEKELKAFSDESIKEYLAGNLCRCSGFMSQQRSIKKYLEEKRRGK